MLSWEQRQKVYQPQRSQNSCEQIKATIQSLDDYDEANEEEQRQLSYAISYIFFQKSSWPIRATCVFSSSSSTAESANAIATDFDAPIHQHLD